MHEITGHLNFRVLIVDLEIEQDVLECQFRIYSDEPVQFVISTLFPRPVYLGSLQLETGRWMQVPGSLSADTRSFLAYHLGSRYR